MNYLGIDFGTTTTIVSCFDEEGKVISLIPYPLYFPDKAELYIPGKAELETMVFYSSISDNNEGKRKKDFIVNIGPVAHTHRIKSYNSVVSGFKPDLNAKNERNHTIVISGDNEREERFSTSVVTNHFFERLCKDLGDALKNKFGENDLAIMKAVVVTVPVDFTSYARQKIKQAIIYANIARSDNLFIIDEPDAAAYAYIKDTQFSQLDSKAFLVYDFGGGTFDLSVVHNTADGYKTFEKVGEVGLGGDLLTQQIVSDLIFKINREYGMDMPQKPEEWTNTLKMRREVFYRNYYCIFSKCDDVIKPMLSDPKKSGISGKVTISEDDGIDFDYEYSYSRDELIELIKDIVNKTIFITEEMLQKAKRNGIVIDRIILAGGSSQICYVKQRLEETFRENGIAVVAMEDGFSSHLVSRGAAYYAAKYSSYIGIDEDLGIKVSENGNPNVFRMVVPAGSRRGKFEIDLFSSTVRKQNGCLNLFMYTHKHIEDTNRENVILCTDAYGCSFRAKIAVSGMEIAAACGDTVKLRIGIYVNKKGEFSIEYAEAVSGSATYEVEAERML